MKKFFGHSGFRIFIPIVDVLLIYASIIFSYSIFKDVLSDFTGNYYAFLSIWPYIGICYIIISHIFELDKPKETNILSIGYTVALVIMALCLATMAISFLAREFAYPRRILGFSSILQLGAITLWHWFNNKMYHSAHKDKTVVIIGYRKAQSLAYKLLEADGIWSRVEHIVKPQSKYLFKYINSCDVIFITEDVEEEKKQEIVRYCVEVNKNILYEPKNPEILLFNAKFTQIDDTPILDVKGLDIQAGSLIFKRIVDLGLALIGLVVFAVPFVFTYLALKISGGTAFFVQERVTRDNKVFKIYKFRSMIENAEAHSGPVLAQKSDSRITPLGHFMRATRLDEVPQIYNVLKGDMSIVGPRPERPFFVDQYSKEMPEYKFRHRVKAGLTGLAQVQGKYNTNANDKLKYDLLYINGYSFALDFKLIMQTLNILLRRSSTEGLKEGKNFEKTVQELIRD